MIFFFLSKKETKTPALVGRQARTFQDDFRFLQNQNPAFVGRQAWMALIASCFCWT